MSKMKGKGIAEEKSYLDIRWHYLLCSCIIQGTMSLVKGRGLNIVLLAI